MQFFIEGTLAAAINIAELRVNTRFEGYGTVFVYCPGSAAAGTALINLVVLEAL